VSRRLLGAILLVVAGIVAVVGTFLPLYEEGNDQQGEGEGRLALLVTVTSWKHSFSNVPEGMGFSDVRSPQYGAPMVVAAVLLAVAAALAFLPEAQRVAARYLAIGGTGLLAGSVWAAGSVVVAWVGISEERDDAGGYAVRAGEGIAVLVASVAIAVVGVVLLHGRRPEPRPEGPAVYRVDGFEVDDDTDTPPFGIPVVEVEVAQLPDSEYDRRADDR
jgi:hypothetical protein